MEEPMKITVPLRLSNPAPNGFWNVCTCNRRKAREGARVTCLQRLQEVEVGGDEGDATFVQPEELPQAVVRPDFVAVGEEPISSPFLQEVMRFT